MEFCFHFRTLTKALYHANNPNTIHATPLWRGPISRLKTQKAGEGGVIWKGLPRAGFRSSLTFHLMWYFDKIIRLLTTVSLCLFIIRWSVGIDRSPLIFVRRFFFLSPIPCPFEIFKSTASIVVKFSSVMPCYETMFPFCISRSKGHRDVIQAPFCEITLSIISS